MVLPRPHKRSGSASHIDNTGFSHPKPSSLRFATLADRRQLCLAQCSRDPMLPYATPAPLRSLLGLQAAERSRTSPPSHLQLFQSLVAQLSGVGDEQSNRDPYLL